MEQIEEAYRLAASNRKKFFIGVFGAFIILAVIGLIENIQKSGDIFSISVFSGIIFFLSLLLIFIINNPSVKGCFRDSLLYKSLEKLGYANEFVNTIDNEIKNELKINFYNKNYKISVFVTKTWLVYISSNNSTIRKVSEISKVYKRISTGGHTNEVFHIDFTDGSCFDDVCNFACDDILELFEKEFPSIYVPGSHLD